MNILGEIFDFLVNSLHIANTKDPKIGPNSWNVTLAPESMYQILAVSTISITSRAFSKKDDINFEMVSARYFTNL